MIEPTEIGAVVVALIAALGAWAAQRAAAKATRYTADAAMMSAKSTAELEAYNRARAMDVQTIQRQDVEFEELRTEYQELKVKLRRMMQDNERLHEENRSLRRRIEKLEKEKAEQ